MTRKKTLLKSVGRSPTWLKTVQISKHTHGKPLTGSFGAAGPVTHIDPKTLPQPKEAAP